MKNLCLFVSTLVLLAGFLYLGKARRPKLKTGLVEVRRFLRFTNASEVLPHELRATQAQDLFSRLTPAPIHPAAR